MHTGSVAVGVGVLLGTGVMLGVWVGRAMVGGMVLLAVGVCVGIGVLEAVGVIDGVDVLVGVLDGNGVLLGKGVLLGVKVNVGVNDGVTEGSGGEDPELDKLQVASSKVTDTPMLFVDKFKGLWSSRNSGIPSQSTRITESLGLTGTSLIPPLAEVEEVVSFESRIWMPRHATQSITGFQP